MVKTYYYVFRDSEPMPLIRGRGRGQDRGQTITFGPAKDKVGIASSRLKVAYDIGILGQSGRAQHIYHLFSYPYLCLQISWYMYLVSLRYHSYFHATYYFETLDSRYTISYFYRFY